MAATKASAVSWPTPSMVINRRQTSDERARRLIFDNLKDAKAAIEALE
jgi:hypothetical protein